MTTKELIKKAEQLFKEKKYQEIIDLLPDELLAEHNSAELYAWRGRAYNGLNSFDNALENANKAIELDGQSYLAYHVRGYICHEKNEFNKAIEDYTKAIRINPKYEDAYYNRGVVWDELGELDKTIEDYTKAIGINPKHAYAYYNRGNAWYKKGELDKAIEDYTKIIEIDSKYATAYYNRGIAFSDKGELNEAIKNYQIYLDLTLEENDYWTKQAKANIQELERKIKSPDYDDITNIVDKIKEALIFEEDCITHYTSLSTAKILILKTGSTFRISEGAFLNDTSEGRALFDFLTDFHITETTNDKTIAEPFTEKPFIGSFVPKTKHDDLTLWRMYGKESGTEAKGCALTIDREKFVDAIKKSIKANNTAENSLTNDDFTFYRVAYLEKKNKKTHFLIPGVSTKTAKQLNELMSELSEEIKKVKPEDKIIITEKLNEIAYLFKSADYLFEHEVRLIIDGVGFAKGIDDETPKVFIELVDIRPALHQITLGPKIEKAEEWASTFNYYLKQNYENLNTKIVISHLPFK
ncbi:tetratricopeptide repeat protein [Flavobacterium sp. D11R37]|uniref:tetratricopeptide repeat protein n=1 Tax=Flavobacterium coralii TaxID=2838017 RepID=UPI001CA75556|nr:tetratricopeptide repeat protein [Flavobacterium coralii]MBY8962878.1 tetratricopeptide repeat protein [Flavobacterium coralii]